MGEVEVVGLDKAVIQTEDKVFMQLFSLGASRVIEVFELTELDDCDFDRLTIEKLLAFVNMKPDVVW